VRSTAAPYTESRLTRSVANERVGFPVVEQACMMHITSAANSFQHVVYLLEPSKTEMSFYKMASELKVKECPSIWSETTNICHF